MEEWKSGRQHQDASQGAGRSTSVSSMSNSTDANVVHGASSGGVSAVVFGGVSGAYEAQDVPVLERLTQLTARIEALERELTLKQDTFRTERAQWVQEKRKVSSPPHSSPMQFLAFSGIDNLG